MLLLRDLEPSLPVSCSAKSSESSTGRCNAKTTVRHALNAFHSQAAIMSDTHALIAKDWVFAMRMASVTDLHRRELTRALYGRQLRHPFVWAHNPREHMRWFRMRPWSTMARSTRKWLGQERVRFGTASGTHMWTIHRHDLLQSNPSFCGRINANFCGRSNPNFCGQINLGAPSDPSRTGELLLARNRQPVLRGSFRPL